MKTSEPPLQVFKRWGKAPHTGPLHLLPFHLVDVASVLQVGLDRRPRLLTFLADTLRMPEGQARAMLLTILALHDIGKVARGVQLLNPAAALRLGLSPPEKPPRSPRHDALGRLILSQLVLVRGDGCDLPRDNDGRTLSLLFNLSTGHHGRPAMGASDMADLRERGVITDDDMTVAADLVRSLVDLFGWREGLPDHGQLKRLSPFLNGLFSLCDWLGSHRAFAYQEQPTDLGRYYGETALRTAVRVLDLVAPSVFRELSPQPAAEFGKLFCRLGRGGSPPVPTPLQALVDRLFTAEALPGGPLLTIIEDLPGSGKTEAGDLIVQRLIALGRACGAYIGLPTMATADAAFARKFDGDDNLHFGDGLFQGVPQVMLAHSRKHRNDGFRSVETRAGVEEGEGYALDWFTRSSRRALLTELGVGTVDQALAGALRAKYSTLRLIGLWRKVLVVDEVHAYDDYMQALLQSLLRWQGMIGDPVVLMSATLPSSIRRALVQAYAEGAGWADVVAMAERTRPGAYPQLTLVSQQGIAQHPVDPVPGPGTRPIRLQAVHDEAVVDGRIAEWLATGRSVIWFRNTVDDAVKAWERLGEFDPVLYHARYLPGDRARHEAALLDAIGKQARPAARRSKLVIATQAAEQSLDLDADEMVTDLAPADAIVQRLGRRRRHPRNQDGSIAADGIEKRPGNPVLLLTPPLEQPGPRWYAGMFRRASSIYEDDARLWCSAQHLLDPDTIPECKGEGPSLVLADDLRPLIEAIYSDPPLGAPDILSRRHYSADGSRLAARQQGLEARLDFRESWIEEWGNAPEAADAADQEPRTRLIDNHTVILAEVVDGAPRLLGQDDSGRGSPVENAECRCPLPLVSALSAEVLKTVLAALRGSLPDRDSMALDRKPVILLERKDDGVWQGLAKLGQLEARGPSTDPGRRYLVEYCSSRGLRTFTVR